MSSPDRVDLVVPGDAAGARIDRFLSEQLDQPRNRVQRWIREGRVEVEGSTVVEGSAVKVSRKLVAGDRIVCTPPEQSFEDRLSPEPGALQVLYEDSHLVVLDKPAGLAMHPGAGRSGGTLANRLIAAYPEMAEVGGPGRPGIVHRLDIDTTGVVVAARSDAAYRGLSDAFSERSVDKRYLGICYGEPRQDSGEIALAIGRHSRRRKEMAVRPDGRPALTRYERLSAASGATLLRLALETGRTHQIRVHLKAIGHPLVGDPVYGEARWKALAAPVRKALSSFPRPALHAWRLEFDHPVDGERQTFVAPVPPDLSTLWAELGGSPIPGGSSSSG